ncbi:hypothetical protein PHLGIDRAFT_130777 [Phlebiopsis gigantea 11061_1 CR5-6]|uniref:Uncharacterized protein n=1 Tax=Phlebiopsis gigantea (strain 11061_1 CR5-6) TaxID=745531 RepID=A0A0C3NCY6_PHLG1|nr:hypothetical protein PHLGIDRAFT_130777 [Phlebiopsis gigantea 11061_1 CR5-6]
MSESIRGETSVNSKADLPPPRDRKGIRPVSPPLSNMSVRRFSHYMTFALALVIAFYAWRLTVWKAEAGSWWNLVLGKQPPAFRDGNTSGGPAVPNVTPTMGSGRDATVEERIHELAVALGMPSKDLASAIAVAVHEHVPPATLSSLAAHQTGEAVQYLVNPEAASASDASATEIAPAASNAAKGAAKLFDAVVGMDEPPAEMM